GNANLSEEMKSFSILAQEKKQTFIKNILLQKTKTVWQAIPTKTMLLMILQEMRGLNDTKEALDEEYEGNESANEEI
ncbi:925_t:CDS:2, partial [Gigaspora margarita]